MDFVLRKWKYDDAESLALCADNRKIWAFLRDAFPHPYTLENANRFINDCITKGDNGQFIRAIDVDGKAVGCISVIVKDDVYCKSAELGYWLSEEYWGNGIMTSAVKQICREAFEKLDIVRIFAEPFIRNDGSRNVLQKNGFLLEGIMKNGVFKNGELMDYCMYALLKEDFE